MRCDKVRPGGVWCGLVGWSKVTVADGSTENLGSPCCSLRRVDAVRFGRASQGGIRHVLAGQGYSGRRQHRGLMLPLLLSLEGGRGRRWHGKVRRGKVRRGKSCRRQHGGCKSSLLLSLESRHGKVWLG
jgi:hypothetical protein